MTSDTPNTPINYQHFFLQLLEAAPWPMLIADRTLSIRFYNQHAVELLTVTEPLQGLALEQVMPDPAIVQLVQESIQTGSPRSGEYKRANSSVAWKVSVMPLEHTPGKTKKHAGTFEYFTIIIEDLSELRRLERVRRDFIANISHELRTPLASMRLLAETLEEAIDTDSEMAQTFVEKIEKELEYLNALVSELLELARIESGQVPMAIEPVEAEQLVGEVLARMLPQAQRHRVALHTEMEQGKTLVAADSKQIVRVLVNLVHNAIKFTPSGGLVVVGTRFEEGGNRQTFFVRDTGVGMPPEDLPRIFERFYKVNRARAKTDFIGPGSAGSGLGLAIARHVIEAHGGRIIVESKVGQGSTFTFSLAVSGKI